MTAKKALLIGVGNSIGLTPLNSPPNNVAALQQVLQAEEWNVKTLINMSLEPIMVAIGDLFTNCKKSDLVLLYFTGHGIKDERGKLHLATSISKKNEEGFLMLGTAVSAIFVKELMGNCNAERQVVILDCCFSGAFGDGWVAMADDPVDVKNQLGGEGRVILTSSNGYSWEENTRELSLYTHYLVEGIKTGAADRNSRREITTEELHEYVKAKVKSVREDMKPSIYSANNAHTIILTRGGIIDPKIPKKESEKGVNYNKLEQLLAAKKWKEADTETGKKMLEAAEQQQRGYLDHNDFKKFPCQDLHTIDQLWMYYSDERFGFSVQNEIWQSLGYTDRYDREIVELFGERIGWRVNGSWNYPNFAFSNHSDVQPGHLPGCGAGFLWSQGSFLAVSLFSRIKTCLTLISKLQ